MSNEYIRELAVYDVKDEVGKETLEWLEIVSKIRDGVGDDWNALNPMQKICLYWLMGDVCGDSRIRFFDCDKSEYVKEKLSYLPVYREAPNLAPYMDTMTSAWSPIKKYLGLEMTKKAGVSFLLSQEGSLLYEQLEEIGAIRFLEVNHTIGNFLPVPKYFNQSRTGFTGAPDYLAEYDQGYLMLKALFDYYKGRENAILGLHIYPDTYPLTCLFEKVREDWKSTVLYETKAWLDHFGTWDRFVKDNELSSMVHTDGTPIKFFPRHSLEKPYPENEDEWKIWFNTAAELIENRSVDITGHIAATREGQA